MIAEALKLIFDKAEQSVDPTPKVRHIGPRTRVVTLAGKMIEETIAKPTLTRIAHTLDDVARLIEKFHGESPTVFVQEDGITVILDDDDRLERIEMLFELSDQFAVFMQLATGKQQRELVRVLRTSLAGCIEHNDFLQIVRQLEFDVNRGSRGTVSHTKESLGRSVNKEVRANAGEMPEQISVRLPLFKVPHDIPSEMVLQCAVTLDIDNERIAIEPTGSSLSAERHRVMSGIVEHLDAIVGEDVTVVSGRCEVAELPQ